MNLKGKVALVTGGSAGIGKAIAWRLGKEGAQVTICGRSSETLETTCAGLHEEGIEVSTFLCDVGVLQHVEEMVRGLTAEFGHLDILVNNAGALEDTPLDSPNDEGWRKVLRTNLDGVYFVTSRVVQHMPDGSRIVNISSVLGKIGVPGAGAYCASKHGLIGLTRATSLELAGRKITANAICPGWVETDLAKLVMDRTALKLEINYEKFRRDALAKVPLGEMIRPEEVASLVHFLVGPDAGSITGQSYNLCGGQVMH
jgi:NAD(P)-dependent dehydrogenase (short-subunit alcohol dehydrogenase family)